MTLTQYLKDNNIDQIEDDAEFIEMEREAVLEYLKLTKINQDNISSEDMQELINRGFDENIFINN